MYTQRTKRDQETYPGESMALPPTVGQKIKNLWSVFNKQCLRFMLAKNYDNASSNDEVMATISSAFLKFSKKFLNQIWTLSATDNV